MIRLLINNWWLLFLRGVLALAFALFIYVFLPFLPAPFLRQFAFAGLAVIFAAFAFATGILTTAVAVLKAGSSGFSWLLLADGAAISVGGLMILLFPGLTLVHVIQLIAAIALLAGVLELVAGVHLRRHLTDEWLLVSGGGVSIAFATGLFLTHVNGAASALTWISLYALANGLAMIGLALRLRTLKNSIHALAEAKPVAKAATESNLV